MPIRSILTLVLGLAALGACAPRDPGAYWADYVAEAQAFGLMRTERAPKDAPLTADLLTRNFSSLGFDVEPDPFGTGDEVREARIIRKWRTPVLYAILASEDDLPRIQGLVSTFATRLSTITGHSIRAATDAPEDSDGPNLYILFGRDAVLQALTEYAADTAEAATVSDKAGGGTGPAQRTSAAGDERTEGLDFLAEVVGPWYGVDSPCAGQVFIGDGRDGTRNGEVMFAIVMIRTELPQILLEACVEEEIAQVTGLLNDDLDVRPTIFNDDQEFALLTDHDAALLKVLYDPRLSPGMNPETAMPIIRDIAVELIGGG